MYWEMTDIDKYPLPFTILVPFPIPPTSEPSELDLIHWLTDNRNVL